MGVDLAPREVIKTGLLCCSAVLLEGDGGEGLGKSSVGENWGSQIAPAIDCVDDFFGEVGAALAQISDCLRRIDP